MTALKDLEKRLEEATGSDRELDLMIFDALGFDAPWPKPGVDGGTFRHWIDFAAHEKRERLYFVQVWRGSSDIPSYTASLDAAVSLCERVLPDKCLTVNRLTLDGRVNWSASVWPSKQKDKSRETSGHGSTAAIALCLAIVRALISKGGEGE